MLVEAVITGTKPLIMSTQRGADPTNPIVRELAKLTKKTVSRLTEQEILDIQRLKFLLNLHWVEGEGVVIPGINLVKAIEEAARIDKKGKDVLRSTQTAREYYKLIHDGPNDREALSKTSRYVDTRLANHGSKNQVRMVLETRPIFQPWGLKPVFQIDEATIDFVDFERWVKRCGELFGLGAYRTIFGRFEAQCKRLN